MLLRRSGEQLRYKIGASSAYDKLADFPILLVSIALVGAISRHRHRIKQIVIRYRSGDQEDARTHLQKLRLRPGATRQWRRRASSASCRHRLLQAIM